MSNSVFPMVQRGNIGAAICLLLGLTTVVVAQATAPNVSNAAEWQRYTVKGEEFSVALPSLPAMNTRNVYLFSLRKTRVQRILGSYANGVAYAIHTYENPEKQSLDAFIETIKRRGRREWSTVETGVSVNNFVGKQWAFTDRTVPGTAQFFATKKHLYVLEAVGAPFEDARLSQFFSSLVLGSKTEGTEVKDGIGAQPVTDDPADQDPSPKLTGATVDQRAVILTKPEPSYTDSARQGDISGIVVLRVVFTSTGGLTNFRVVHGLPFGLTEQAINAAKQLRFVPAVKDGKFVSMWMQLEYNFKIY